MPPSPEFAAAILIDQGGRCLYCDLPLNGYVSRGDERIPLRLEWDHWVPRSGGGKGKDNWVASCHICNNIKNARLFGSISECQAYILKRRKAKGYTKATPELVKCLGCGEMFETPRQDHYCSPDCQYDPLSEKAVECTKCSRVFNPVSALIRICPNCNGHGRGGKLADPVECRNCGKDFIRLHRGTRYCEECRKPTYRPYNPEDKLCLRCSKVFRAYRSRQKYCSRECSAGATNIPGAERECPQCGGTFYLKHSTQKYCSPECRAIAGRRPRTRRNCDHCGATFAIEHPSQLYCSLECRKIHNNHKTGLGTRECKRCGEDFTPKNWWQVRCPNCFGRRTEETVCVGCGNSFFPDTAKYRAHWHRQYCSVECWREYR